MSFLISDCTSPILVQTIKSSWILPQKSSDFSLPIQTGPIYPLQENAISLLSAFWNISNGCFLTGMGTLLRQPKSKVSCQGLCMLELRTGQTAYMNFSPRAKHTTFVQWPMALLSWFYISRKLYWRIHCPAQRSYLGAEAFDINPLLRSLESTYAQLLSQKVHKWLIPMPSAKLFSKEEEHPEVQCLSEVSAGTAIAIQTVQLMIG